MSTADLQFTRYTAITPKRLSKRFTHVGGALIKEGGGNMTDGIAERLTVASLAEFATLLPTLTPNQALSYGINGHDCARVVVKEAVVSTHGDLPVIARTRDYFEWSSGPGVMMLDYDPAADAPPLAREALYAALLNACPVLIDTPMIWRPSASSCIHTGDQELRGIAGQRLYVPVLDARDIPRAGQALFDRLWLAGHGRYELSKSGAFLPRSLIDASVFQPERLDFCGGADCGKGLVQKLPDPIIFHPDAAYLDTVLIPDLSPDERQTLADLQDTLKQALAEEQARVRETWIASRVDECVKSLSEAEQEVTRPVLERVYRQAAEGGRLGLDFALTIVKKGGKTRKIMTVRELLRDRKAWHEATTLDPLEPDYPDGQARLVGWLNLRAREPYLQSQAHGGSRYFLGVEPAPIPEPPLDDDGYLEALMRDAEAKAEQKSAIERTATIRCIPGELPEMVDQAEAILCHHETNFYQRSGQLVRWCVSHPETVRGVTRPGGAILILSQDADYLLDRLNRLIQWERWNEREQEYRVCNAPRPVATTLLARRGHWNAQRLVAVINAPTLRPDGSILDQPGYDAATGLLFVNTAIEFGPIPQHPTRAQALDALAFLKNEVIGGFPFAQDHDRSAALSAMLTVTVRHALKNAPMHTFTAPVMASGKSLLADVVSLLVTGVPATVMSFTRDADEMRKRVLAVLMQGDLVVNLDNVEEPLASQTLCSVLTQESFTDRILGVSKTGTAPTLCCWLATGNNLVIAGDLTTRVVPCALDPQVERPEEREFNRDLYEWMPAHRPRLIREALTVLRAYVVAGRPKQAIKNFARFEDWSGWIRSALVWLGEADPLAGREALEDGDPIRVKLRALLVAWHGEFKSVDATVKEAKARALETRLDDDRNEVSIAPLLRETLEDHFADRTGAISSNALGYFLRQHAGRIESGARFEAHGGNAARSAWRVVILDADRFKQVCVAAKLSERGESSQSSQSSQPSLDPEPAFQRDPEPPPGWDGWDSWDKPADAEIFAASEARSESEFVATASASHRSLATRILDALSACPGGVVPDDLTRTVGNFKGSSPAMVRLVLERLVKEGAIGKINGRWVEVRS